MRKLRLVLPTVVMTIAMSFTAFAGSWQGDSTGWWYQNDDGTYMTGGWQWIDGNNDGISECYYFNEQGYCLMNTITPDNCSVNHDGAWTVDGVVQQQTMSTPTVPDSAKPNESTMAKSNIVWLSKTGTKYHRDSTCGNMKDPIESTLEDAIAQGKTPCSKCY